MSTPKLPTGERREQLALAALSILSTKGARELTVKEIARAVGITDGAVFRHFKDKEALLEAAVSCFASSLSALPPQELPPVERLGRFFVERVTAVQARPQILGLVFNDRLQQVVGPTAAARLRKTITESVTFVRACIQEAQRRGELDDTLRPAVVTSMVTGAMRGAASSGEDPVAAWGDVRRALFRRRRAKVKR